MKTNIVKELSKKNIMLMTLSLIIAILGLTFVVLIKTVFNRGGNFALEAVSMQLDDVDEKIESFVKPATDNLSILRLWSLGEVIGIDEQERLFKIVIPLFTQYPQISGFSFSNSSGQFLELTRKGDNWESLTVSYNSLQNRKEYSWIRFDADAKIKDRWQGMLPELFPEDLLLPDDELLPWEQSLYWEFSKRANESGSNMISCATQWRQNKLVYKVSIDFLLNDVAKSFKTMFHSNCSQIFMIRPDSKVMSLYSGTSVSEQLSSDSLVSVIKDWGQGPTSGLSARIITEEGIVYAIKPSKISIGAHVGIIVYEKLITRPGGPSQLSVFLPISIGITILGFVMFFLILFLHKNEKVLAPQTFDLPDDPDSWRKFISKGESAFLEFKSSLRWDVKNSCKEARLEEVIMKAVSAFGNSDGGVLLIGINDNGEILGLANDYTTLKTPDKDSFELHLRNLLNTEYGVDFTSGNISVEFPVVDGKEFCAVTILKSDKPLYVRMSDPKSGKKIGKALYTLWKLIA